MDRSIWIKFLINKLRNNNAAKVKNKMLLNCH